MEGAKKVMAHMCRRSLHEFARKIIGSYVNNKLRFGPVDCGIVVCQLLERSNHFSPLLSHWNPHASLSSGAFAKADSGKGVVFQGA
jgi:hypothetical protein